MKVQRWFGMSLGLVLALALAGCGADGTSETITSDGSSNVDTDIDGTGSGTNCGFCTAPDPATGQCVPSNGMCGPGTMCDPSNGQCVLDTGMGGSPMGGMATGGAPAGGGVTGGAPAGGGVTGGAPAGGTPTGGNMMGCMNGDTRCNGLNLETCSGGSYMVTQTCTVACQAGACVDEMVVPGTCTSPTPLPLDGTSVSGTTDTTYFVNTWSNPCGLIYGRRLNDNTSIPTPGGETVFTFTLTNTTHVQFTLEPDPNTAASFGVYIRNSCTQSNSADIWAACEGSSIPGETLEFSEVLAAGEYFVFVDSFAGQPTGNFTLTARPAPPAICSDATQTIPGTVIPLPDIPLVPTYVDFDASGRYTHSGSTPSSGFTTWTQSSVYCNDYSSNSNGGEALYILPLREQSNVTITLSHDMGAGAPTNDFAVYLRPFFCEDDRLKSYLQSSFGPIDLCTSGSNSGPANQTFNLPAGTYFLFVDGKTSGAINYTLTVELLP